MAVFARFEDMKIWQEARELVVLVYAATAKTRFSLDYGLKDQMQRAAVSVCSNIAEGYERSGNKEFSKFLWIAKGSAGEVASQLYHAKDLQYLTADEFSKLYGIANGLCAKIYKLIKSLSTSPNYKKLSTLNP